MRSGRASWGALGEQWGDDTTSLMHTDPVRLRVLDDPPTIVGGVARGACVLSSAAR